MKSIELQVPLILTRMARYWNHVTESSSSVIQDTLKHSKQLQREAKTSWLKSSVKILELIYNLNLRKG